MTIPVFIHGCVTGALLAGCGLSLHSDNLFAFLIYGALAGYMFVSGSRQMWERS